jgi:hypothetical protein
MKLEDDINETITRVCDEFARAIEKYDNISGGLPPPEYFLPSHVLLGLGDVLTMTVETNYGTLWRWNEEKHGKNDQRPQDFPSGRRVDLVIFKGDHTKKDEMEFLCLVECKLGWVSQRDITKLTELLRHIDTCRYGAICTALETPQKDGWLLQCKNAAQGAGRTHVVGRIAHPLYGQPQDWQTYAEILVNPQYQP